MLVIVALTLVQWLTERDLINGKLKMFTEFVLLF